MKPEEAYRTRQREALLDCVRENEGRHFTAGELAFALAARGEAVGKSTVYRCLNALAAKNVVRKYPADKGKSACYQYNCGHEACGGHYHLQCAVCGALLHADSPALTRAVAALARQNAFRIDTEKIVFTGECEKCRA
jgi:Fur family ferric uptake transcriptional regulator